MRSPEMRDPALAQIDRIFFFGLDFFRLSAALLSAKARAAMASAYGPEQLIVS